LKKKGGWRLVEGAHMMYFVSVTFVFRCKRHPDGSVRRLKQDSMSGATDIDYFAPVVKQKLFVLIFTLFVDLASKQVDETCTFTLRNR